MSESEVTGREPQKKHYRRPQMWKEILQVGGRRWKAVKLAFIETDGDPVPLSRFYAAPGYDTFKRLAEPAASSPRSNFKDQS
jgi:hypothetical protein